MCLVISAACYQGYVSAVDNVNHESVTNILFTFLAFKLDQAVDAIDNGINQYDVDLPARYVNNTSLSSRVGRLNLDWVDPDQSPERENEAFQRAMMLAGGEFLEV